MENSKKAGGRPKRNVATVQLNVRVDASLVARLVDAAKAEQTSVRAIVERIIAAGLPGCEEAAVVGAAMRMTLAAALSDCEFV